MMDSINGPTKVWGKPLEHPTLTGLSGLRGRDLSRVCVCEDWGGVYGKGVLALGWGGFIGRGR